MNQQIFNEHSIEAAVDIQEKSRKGGWSPKYLTHLPIVKDEIVLVRFLETEALTFYQHYVKDPLLNNGSGAFRNLTCSRDGCPICPTKTEWSKPRWMAAYRVIHLDDPDGPRMRVFARGVIAMTLLEKKQKRLKQQGRDINMADCEIDRSGEGFKTLYTFDFKEPSPAIEAYEQPEAVDLVEYFKIDMEALIRIGQMLQTLGGAPAPRRPAANTAPAPTPVTVNPTSGTAPAPVTPAPVAPVTPAPVTPAPVAPDPVAPAPVAGQPVAPVTPAPDAPTGQEPPF